MSKKKWKMRGAKKSEQGFTLIEAIIGLFIFTVGILAAVSMQVSAINGNGTAQHLSQAAIAAANEVESLRPLDYMTDDNLTQHFDSNDVHRPIQVGNYTITYSVERDALLENTMLVNVRVDWLERGAPKTMNLVYIKHDTI